MLTELEPGQKFTLSFFGQTFEYIKQSDGSFIRTVETTNINY